MCARCAGWRQKPPDSRPGRWEGGERRTGRSAILTRPSRLELHTASRRLGGYGGEGDAWEWEVSDHGRGLSRISADFRPPLRSSWRSFGLA